MFICAAHKQLDLTQLPRLYAYPTKPDLSGDKMIILDSGAFALSKSKKRMDAEYMQCLADHYRRYSTRENVYAIAPDVFKNPVKSLQQFRYFSAEYPDIDIAPVIQFNNRTIDLFNAKKQIDAYSQYSKSKLVCISNNKFKPLTQHNDLRRITDFIRARFGNVWVHVLGAGYSHNNVRDWLKTGVNSIDSISYYTDAQNKLAWLPHSYQHESSALPFTELAMHNAKLANL